MTGMQYNTLCSKLDKKTICPDLFLSNATPLIVHARDVAVPFWRGRLLRVNWHQQLNLLLDFWKNQKNWSVVLSYLPALAFKPYNKRFFFSNPFCSEWGHKIRSTSVRTGIQWCYKGKKLQRHQALLNYAHDCLWKQEVPFLPSRGVFSFLR